MRMVHYFLVVALLLLPGIAWTLYTGLVQGGGDGHFNAGLFTSILAVAVHTLLILFMIITGRVLKEAMRSRPLGPEFLTELNQFFARKSAYPLAVFSSFAIVTAAVLGNAGRGFGISPAWHYAVGAGACMLNLWALMKEYQALLENQRLLDRVAGALDQLDRDGDGPAPEEPITPQQIARWGLIVGISAWFPYLYWALVVWRGRFDQVSVHPWIEGSLAGFAIWWLARRADRIEPSE